MSIAWHYLVQYLKVRLSYRWDFLAEFLGELVGTAAGLAFLVGVFAGAGMPAIAGWPRDAVLFIYGFSMIGYGCFELFAEAFYRFSDQYLIEGRFDQVLLKPFSPLLQVLLAGFNPMAMTEWLLGLGLLLGGVGLLIGVGMLVPFLDRSKSRHPLDRPLFFVLGLLALFYFLAFTTLIMWNIAVIEREPPLILLITTVVMSLAFVWHLLRRRRQLARSP